MSKESKIPPLPKSFGWVFSLIVLLAVLVLNTWASLDGVINNTISAWVTYGASLAAGIPVGISGVLGHWASRGQGIPNVPGGPLAFMAVVGLFFLVDWKTQGFLARYPFWVWMLMGISLGAILWPMNEVAT